MISVDYIKRDECSFLKEWFLHYGMREEMIDEMPRIGFVSLDSCGPIAVAFLRLMEGRFALFDGLMANPKSSGKRRYEGINKVVNRLIEESIFLNIEKVIAYTMDRATLKRAIKHGFEVKKDCLMALDVKGI